MTTVPRPTYPTVDITPGAGDTEGGGGDGLTETQARALVSLQRAAAAKTGDFTLAATDGVIGWTSVGDADGTATLSSVTTYGTGRSFVLANNDPTATLNLAATSPNNFLDIAGAALSPAEYAVAPGTTVLIATITGAWRAITDSSLSAAAPTTDNYSFWSPLGLQVVDADDFIDNYAALVAGTFYGGTPGLTALTLYADETVAQWTSDGSTFTDEVPLSTSSHGGRLVLSSAMMDTANSFSAESRWLRQIGTDDAGATYTAGIPGFLLNEKLGHAGEVQLLAPLDSGLVVNDAGTMRLGATTWEGTNLTTGVLVVSGDENDPRNGMWVPATVDVGAVLTRPTTVGNVPFEDIHHDDLLKVVRGGRRSIAWIRHDPAFPDERKDAMFASASGFPRGISSSDGSLTITPGTGEVGQSTVDITDGKTHAFVGYGAIAADVATALAAQAAGTYFYGGQTHADIGSEVGLYTWDETTATQLPQPPLGSVVSCVYFDGLWGQTTYATYVYQNAYGTPSVVGWVPMFDAPEVFRVEPYTEAASMTAAAVEVAFLDTTGGTFPFTIDDPADWKGRDFTIKWTAGSVAPTFDGANVDGATPTMSAVGDVLRILSDGFAWYRLDATVAPPTATTANYATRVYARSRFI